MTDKDALQVFDWIFHAYQCPVGTYSVISTSDHVFLCSEHSVAPTASTRTTHTHSDEIDMQILHRHAVFVAKPGYQLKVG